MVKFRILMFLRNENLIQKLADSYPIRRAAQLSVYLLNKATTPALESKTLSEIAEKLKKVKESAQVFRNEDIIQKLADSYPIRRAAQLSVYLFNKATTPALEFKNLTEVAEKLKKMKESIKKEMK